MSSRRVVGLGIAGVGAIVALMAGGTPSRAVPDAWSFGRFVALVPALLACGWAPGHVLTHGLRRFDPWAQAGLAVLVSCLASFAVGVLLLLGGVPLEDVGRWGGAVVVALGLAHAFLPARQATGEASGEAPGFRPGVAVLALGAWVLVVAVIYVANPELRFRVDGWFHGAVAARVAQVGIPPDDPWFAGFRLLYFWAYHVVLDLTVALAPRGSSAFDALAGWACLSAFASGALVVSLGRAWARAAGAPERQQRAAGVWALAFAVLATNPLGWLLFLARTAVGRDRGTELLVRPFEEGASSVLGGLTWSYPHVSMASFADKFLTPTAFGLGYAAFLAMLAALCFRVFGNGAREQDGRSRARTILAGGAAILAGLLLHVLVGFAAVFALLGAIWVSALVARAGGERLRVALVAAAVAVTLALPYLVAVLAGKQGTGPRLEPRPDMAWAIVATGALYFVFAVPAVWRGLSEGGPRREATLAMFFLLAAALTTTMVQRNETKFVNLAFLALALPAGAVAATVPRRALAALAVALPTSAVAWTGFALDPGRENLGKRVPDIGSAEAYAWIAANTSPRDVFLEAQSPDPVNPEEGESEPSPQGAPFHDPVRDLLVHGPRPLVWGGDGYASNWGYPKESLEARRRAANELATLQLSAESYAWLEHFARTSGHDVYVIDRLPMIDTTLTPNLDFMSPGGGPWTHVHGYGPRIWRLTRDAEAAAR
ncbi:MAG: hypothetical protein ACREOU_15355 [Candidatus Eiseniibacteriota bacterium]